MARILAAALLAALLAPVPAQAEFPKSWRDAKNTAQDEVYRGDRTQTFYCGCAYQTHDDNDGSGDVDLAACGMAPLSSNLPSAGRIEWEHIVPASLMPAREHACWDQSEQFPECVSASGNVTRARDCCVRVSPAFNNMIFDLHNLAPAIGQVNQYRSNGRYGEVRGGAEQWPGCDAKDLGGTSAGSENLFEPPDCMKGNVARVWLYMSLVHGVAIPEEERRMFERWSRADPVSPWERTRDERIDSVQGGGNPFVATQAASEAGNCSWD